MSTAAVIGHPVLPNFFIKHTKLPISGRLDLIQATMVSIDRKLEGLGLKQQEVEKKIEDLEITTDSPDAIITENTAALKNVINSLENNLRQKAKRLGFGGQWKAPARTVLIYFSVRVSRLFPQRHVGKHDTKACSYPSYPSTSHLKENVVG